MGEHTQCSTRIGSHTILPARRERIEFTTADAVPLVGELALPEEGPPVATLILLHPLPTHGGSMDSHLFRKAAWRLPALAQLAVLRFNTRGTGSAQAQSGGSFANGDAERADVLAAVEFAHLRALPHIWLVGWSFGTELALMYGANLDIDGAILLSPPLKKTRSDHLVAWAASRKPLRALVPENDTYLRPREAKTRFALVPQARVIPVDGAVHLWIGEKHVKRVLNEIVEITNPTAAPLPTHWDGLSTTYRIHARQTDTSPTESRSN
jgi:alpha/beta superfamily hydrolase